VQATLQHDPGEHRARRSVQAGIPENLAEQPDAGDRRPRWSGGRPISVFESGAILQYLGRKTGQFYPTGERARVAVDEWLFWQMANLGPKAGEANHFRRYAPERLPYALERFGNEINRLYGVMNTRLKDRRFLAGRYSIADVACVGWIRLFERQQEKQEKEGVETFAGFPHLKRWLATVRAAGGSAGYARPRR
jgi:GST-like protein